eukprot:930552_1
MGLKCEAVPPQNTGSRYTNEHSENIREECENRQSASFPTENLNYNNPTESIELNDDKVSPLQLPDNKIRVSQANSKAQKHLKKVTNVDKPFRCQLCPKTCIRKGDAVEHVRCVHLKLTPYH